DLALSDFTGQQLLEAYTGPDRGERQQAFANQAEALRASYKEARRALHENSTRLLRHERRDLKRLEKALAQELSVLDRGLFDLSRIQDQVQHTEHSHFLRSFFFDEVNDRYIYNFCRKYASEPAYRADVENGTAPWIERNALFLKNLESSWWRETVGELPPNADGVAELQSFFEEQFFEWICRHAKGIMADTEYQHLRQIEQASPAVCRAEGVDAGMGEVALAWNAIPGVAVSSSCQGTSGVISYAGRLLLVPSDHDECAYVTVAVSDETLAEAIERCRSAFPHIRSTLFSRPIGLYRGANQRYCQLRSVAALDNAQVRRNLLSIALQVRAQLLS
ncbi:MAG: hypothetical protein ACXVCM_23435, partial [Ktedonobacteraceae bacterium]